MKLLIGTRGSRLARVQTMWIAERIRSAYESISIDIVEIVTAGDRIQDVPLGPELGQSFFTKEIERALLDERIDVAVHSCKDLSTVATPGLVLAAIPEREDPRDALVSRCGRLADLPSRARVATSSPRRRGFLSLARSDLALLEQRGNVPTRLRAVEEGRVDAVVLALAGLRRLGVTPGITETLEPSVMLPAAGQGALAVQVREDDASTLRLVAPLDDFEARASVTAERTCIHKLEAGCQAPVGALGRLDGHELHLTVGVVTPRGCVRVDQAGPPGEGARLGAAAAAAILGQLGLSSLREARWAGGDPARLVGGGEERS